MWIMGDMHKLHWFFLTATLTCSSQSIPGKSKLDGYELYVAQHGKFWPFPLQLHILLFNSNCLVINLEIWLYGAQTWKGILVLVNF